MAPDELERLFMGTTHRDEEPEELHSQGEDTSCYEIQGNNVIYCTSLSLKIHCDILISRDINDSLSHSDNVYVESAHTLMDLINDRTNSFCKINLCSPSVHIYVLSDITFLCISLSCYDNVHVENVDTLVYPIYEKIDSSSIVFLCLPSADKYVLNNSSLSKDISVDQLVCNNPLFNVDITNDGEIHSDVFWHDRSVFPLKGYPVIENPLWYNHTLS